MCNCRHPGPRRVWDGGSAPQFLTPLPRLPSLPWLPPLPPRVPKSLFLSSSIALQRPPHPWNRGAQFILCASCGLGEGRGAPVRAPAPPTPLSTEKHICFGQLFFNALPGTLILNNSIALGPLRALREDNLGPLGLVCPNLPETSIFG